MPADSLMNIQHGSHIKGLSTRQATWGQEMETERSRRFNATGRKKKSRRRDQPSITQGLGVLATDSVGQLLCQNLGTRKTAKQIARGQRRSADGVAPLHIPAARKKKAAKGILGLSGRASHDGQIREKQTGDQGRWPTRFVPSTEPRAKNQSRFDKRDISVCPVPYEVFFTF